MTPAALSILIACAAGFLAQEWMGPRVDFALGLWPPGTGYGDPPFRFWQLVTHGFLHADLKHLAVNMFGLYMFGPEVERLVGSRRFLLYFVVCVIGGALTHLAVMQVTGERAWALGASGGIFGVLLAYGMSFPKREVMLLFPPIPMPAWLLVTIYGLVELYAGVSGRNTGVGHFAHLGGMVGGLALLLYWRAQRAAGRSTGIRRP